MALASLIFGNTAGTVFKDPVESLTILTVDATIRSSHSSQATLTKRELEDGSIISDHMTTTPESVTIEGVISETPLDLFNSIAGSLIGGAASLASQAGPGAAFATGLLGGALLAARNGSRALNAFDSMVDLQKQRKKFDLVTGLKNYKDMVITSVVATRSAEIGQGMSFVATIENVVFVKSQLVTLTEAEMNANAGATGATDLGKQSATEASEDTAGNGSVAFNLAEAGGAFQ